MDNAALLFGSTERLDPVDWATSGKYNVAEGAVADGSIALAIRFRMTISADVYGFKAGNKTWSPG